MNRAVEGSLRDRLRALGAEPDQERFLIAWSGGPDSTCLLSMAVEEGLDVVAAHLDHGQRHGSDVEQRSLLNLAESWGVAMVPGRADVPLMAQQAGLGLEEAGRLARQNFLERARLATGCRWILTGHTRDDQAETVLFRLVRGSGLTGVSGVPPRRDPYLRPLLDITRAQTEEYCASRGIPVVRDASNDNEAFARVRLRKRVLPELRAINPRADEHIAAFAEHVREEDRFLDAMAAAALERSEVVLNGSLRFLTIDSEAAFDQGRLAGEPAVLRRRAVRLVVRALGGHIEAGHLAAMDSAWQGGVGSLTTPGYSVDVTWDGAQIRFAKRDSIEPFRENLETPGVLEAASLGWQIEVLRSSGEPPRTADRLTVGLSQRAIEGQLYIRSVGAGDKMRPLGAPGRRLLSDILADQGLTRMARRRLPIVCDLLGPVWIPGGPIEERVRVKDGEPFWLVRLSQLNATDGKLAPSNDR